jgi:hypothetical protein
MSALRAVHVRRAAALGVLAAGLALAGCFNPFSPRIAPTLGVSKPAPIPNTASGVLRLLEWCYNNKAIAEYSELFTADYQFNFSDRDSAGQDWESRPYTRTDELISTTNLFIGGSATEPAATSIRLTFDKNFFVYADPFFVYYPVPDNTVFRDPSGRRHKSIRTTVSLRIEIDDGSSLEIDGHATFYMVRGDSALIPDDLKAKGFKPDSTRWYIRQWDDETATGGTVALARATGPGRVAGPGDARRLPGLHDTQPSQVASWGAIKAYYRLLATRPTALRPQSP